MSTIRIVAATLALLCSPVASNITLGSSCCPDEFSDVYQEAIKKPNATGVVKFDGFDAVANDSTWELGKAVTEVELPNDKFSTYESVWLNTGSDVQLSSNDTRWSLCLYYLEGLPGSSGDDDDACQATLGDECARDYQKAIMQARRDNSYSDDGPCDGLPLVSVPDSCSNVDDVKDSLITGSFQPGSDYDYDHGNASAGGIYFQTSEQHGSDDTKPYDEAVTKTDALFTLLYPVTEDWSDYDNPMWARWTCLQPDDISPGSRSAAAGLRPTSLAIPAILSALLLYAALA